MGKPKFSRKKYETPSHPWQEDRIKEENELIKKYGLKNKKEVWKAKTKLGKYRGQARELLAKIKTGEAQSKMESDQLLMHLNRMNILPPSSTLDDVLALDIETILSRRLQTLTYLKGLANTPDQSRQLISHGHIAIGEKRITVPSYMVTKDEEGEIRYTFDSPLNDTMHPARPKPDFKSVPVKKEVKPEEEAPPDKEKEETPKGEPKEEPPAEPTTEPEQPKKETTEPPAEHTPEPEPTKEGEEAPAEKLEEKPPAEEPTAESKDEDKPSEEPDKKDKKPEGEE